MCAFFLNVCLSPHRFYVIPVLDGRSIESRLLSSFQNHQHKASLLLLSSWVWPLGGTRKTLEILIFPASSAGSLQIDCIHLLPTDLLQRWHHADKHLCVVGACSLFLLSFRPRGSKWLPIVTGPQVLIAFYNLFIFFHFIFIFQRSWFGCVCVWTCMSHSTHVEVRSLSRSLSPSTMWIPGIIPKLSDLVANVCMLNCLTSFNVHFLNGYVLKFTSSHQLPGKNLANVLYQLNFLFPTMFPLKHLDSTHIFPLISDLFIRNHQPPLSKHPLEWNFFFPGTINTG